MTNADRIRAMSDEELAAFMEDGYKNWCDDDLCDSDKCDCCILEWLKQEVEDE